MPYMSKSSLVADQQLVVQQLSIAFSDKGLFSQSGSVVTVDVGEQVLQIDSAEVLKASGPSVVLNAPGSNAIVNGSGTNTAMQLTLLAALASGDVLRLQYRTQQ